MQYIILIYNILYKIHNILYFLNKIILNLWYSFSKIFSYIENVDDFWTFLLLARILWPIFSFLFSSNGFNAKFSAFKSEKFFAKHSKKLPSFFSTQCCFVFTLSSLSKSTLFHLKSYNYILFSLLICCLYF